MWDSQDLAKRHAEEAEDVAKHAQDVAKHAQDVAKHAKEAEDVAKQAYTSQVPTITFSGDLIVSLIAFFFYLLFITFNEGIFITKKHLPLKCNKQEREKMMPLMK